MKRLSEAGFEVADLGSVQFPSLRRHNTPPIRNYPAPREAWEAAESFIANQLTAEKGLIFALGGDCSIMAGT